MISELNKVECHTLFVENLPIDRPWGRRAAAFSDPTGNVLEIAQEIA